MGYGLIPQCRGGDILFSKRIMGYGYVYTQRKTMHLFNKLLYVLSQGQTDLWIKEKINNKNLPHD
jgi:hypothetical protein